MNSFLYYFPGGAPVITREAAAAAGLGYALPETGGATCCGTNAGPDGGAGTVAVFAGNTPAAYTPEAQAWRKGPQGKYWVGYWKDRKPGEADLRREHVYEGTGLRLRDGGLWVVPRCYAPLPARPLGLPMKMDLAEDAATWVLKPAEEYAGLCQTAQRLWEMFVGAARNDLTSKEELAAGVSALAVNYRLSALEVAMLGLWTTRELAGILRALIDADAVEEAFKATGSEKKTTDAATTAT